MLHAAKIITCIFFFSILFDSSNAQQKKPYHVIAFYTAMHDPAHISFVHEANRWFSSVASENHFTYDSTNNWDLLDSTTLSHYQLVIFLDTRPDSDRQRRAFEHYMNNGGAWVGFHFSAFALTPSAYPENWPWYHQTFLGSGQYKSNTWRPTSAVLRIEDLKHPIARHLPVTFHSSPNEWYRWENDLRNNPDVKILISIDSTSFPLGTGPKPNEIWHNGYYPVVWTNTKYNMVYFNMGHNDMDYEHKTNKELSQTFSSKEEDQMILNAIKWLLFESKI
jgi:Trehalose utilisation.